MTTLLPGIRVGTPFGLATVLDRPKNGVVVLVSEVWVIESPYGPKLNYGTVHALPIDDIEVLTLEAGS